MAVTLIMVIIVAANLNCAHRVCQAQHHTQNPFNLTVMLPGEYDYCCYPQKMNPGG